MSPLSYYTFSFFPGTAQIPFSRGWRVGSLTLISISCLSPWQLQKAAVKTGGGGRGGTLASHRLDTSLNFCKPVSLFINGTNHFSCYGQVSQCNFFFAAQEVSRYRDINLG